MLATSPFLPRLAKCWLINWWMTSLYKKCGIQFMGPAEGSAFNFTGQCNDAFFQYTHKVAPKEYALPEGQTSNILPTNGNVPSAKTEG
jgi:hypothetical protein